MKYVNLKRIVHYMNDQEIQNDPVSPEERLEALYEKCRRYLLEIFHSIDFDPELLKKDGEYQIPVEDGQFIEWLLDEFTSVKMKLVRNGKYQEAGDEYLFKIISGIEKLLEDLQVDEVVRQKQNENIMRKTEYPLIVRLHNIKGEFEKTLNNLIQYVYTPTFHLTMDVRCAYLDCAKEAVEKCGKKMGEQFLKIWTESQKDIDSTKRMFLNEGIECSPKIFTVWEALRDNSEYMVLREELCQLEEKKQPLIKYEKQRKQILTEMQKIVDRVFGEQSIEMEQLAEVEKFIYTSDDEVTLTKKNGGDGWYLVGNNYKFPGHRG